jgi:hypothetical protein
VVNPTIRKPEMREIFQITRLIISELYTITEKIKKDE